MDVFTYQLPAFQAFPLAHSLSREPHHLATQSVPRIVRTHSQTSACAEGRSITVPFLLRRAWTSETRVSCTGRALLLHYKENYLFSAAEGSNRCLFWQLYGPPKHSMGAKIRVYFVSYIWKRPFSLLISDYVWRAAKHLKALWMTFPLRDLDGSHGINIRAIEVLGWIPHTQPLN